MMYLYIYDGQRFMQSSQNTKWPLVRFHYKNIILQTRINIECSYIVNCQKIYKLVLELKIWAAGHIYTSLKKQ